MEDSNNFCSDILYVAFYQIILFIVYSKVCSTNILLGGIMLRSDTLLNLLASDIVIMD